MIRPLQIGVTHALRALESAWNAMEYLFSGQGASPPPRPPYRVRLPSREACPGRPPAGISIHG